MMRSPMLESHTIDYNRLRAVGEVVADWCKLD